MLLQNGNNINNVNFYEIKVLQKLEFMLLSFCNNIFSNQLFRPEENCIKK